MLRRSFAPLAAALLLLAAPVHAAFIILPIVSAPITSYAQGRPAAPALERDSPKRPAPTPDYVPYPPPPEVYVPPLEDYCKPYANDPEIGGCYFLCHRRSADLKSCEALEIDITVMLGRGPSQLDFTRRSDETPVEFFDRYNAAAVDAALRAGADPNSTQAKKVLLAAIANQSTETARRLIAAGTKVNPGDGGRALLALSASNNKQAMLDLIRSGADVNARVMEGTGNEIKATPLWNAFRYGVDLDIVQALIKAGVNVNESLSNSERTTALLEAVQVSKDRLALVKMLLAAGAKARAVTIPYDMDDHHENALIRTGCDSADAPDVIRALLEAGADPNFYYFDKINDKDVSVLKHFKNQFCPYKNQVISVLKQFGAK
jgi:hypothetical protein